jgi:peptidoglycan/xylan/chitin deacetylase (PgdA/CDA1 family)
VRIQASFDDGTIEDLYLAELMQKYEIPTIFYWPVYPERVNEIKGRDSLTMTDMKIIAQQFEVGSHTLTHPLLTRIADHLAWAEIDYSRKMLQDRFGQEIKSFAYPRGYANSTLQLMVKEAGYSDARSTLVGYIHDSENAYFTQTTLHIAPRKEYGGLSWLEYGRRMLKQARKTKDSVFHLWAHGWEIEKNHDWDDFELFIKELTA